MLFFTPRKSSLFDQTTKIYLNTSSYKNNSVYYHPDTEILLSKIIDFLAGVGQTYMVNN